MLKGVSFKISWKESTIPLMAGMRLLVKMPGSQVCYLGTLCTRETHRVFTRVAFSILYKEDAE